MGSTDTVDTMDPALKERISAAIGRMASGVYILTIEDESGREGMLATWVAQGGFKPPIVTVAVNNDRPILSRLKRGVKATLNVLAKTNNDIFKNFVKPHTEGMDRFAGLDLVDQTAYPPAFAGGVSYMHLEIENLVDAGDHKIMVAKIVDGAMLNKDSEPMVHFRRDGFQY
ncbi:MAG: flavin reductase family protein [Candidatus Obscuribacterales bacterium]|nr:flavin reductase family protein [Candidatus Obscuribacterales bacterium]